MAFPQLTQFTHTALLLLRFMVGLVFITSAINISRTPQREARTSR
jgi:hypothetical protein